jgi:hypothetical protein
MKEEYNEDNENNEDENIIKRSGSDMMKRKHNKKERYRQRYNEEDNINIIKRSGSGAAMKMI